MSATATMMKPLLSEDEHIDIDDFQFYYKAKGSNKIVRTIPRTPIILLLMFIIIYALNTFDKSMEHLKEHECNDVLSNCSHLPFNETVLPPFVDYLQDFTISTKYKMSLCLVPKVMSTIGSAVFCYLQNSTSFTMANLSISSQDYFNRSCASQEVKTYAIISKIMPKFENIIVIRDPIDRFISGFTEKCIIRKSDNYCHGCGEDLRCFIRKEYRRLKRISMLFPIYTTADTHFAPQTWYCKMSESFNKSKVIRYGHNGKEGARMIQELSSVFRENGVLENEIKMIEDELSKGKTHHSTNGDTSRAKIEDSIKNDPEIRRALYRMYFHDFQVLGYDFNI